MFVLKGDKDGYTYEYNEEATEHEHQVVAHDVKYFKFTKFPVSGNKRARLVAIAPKALLSEYDVAVGVNRKGLMVQFCMVTDDVDGTSLHYVNPRMDAINRELDAPYDVLHKRFAQLFKRVLKKQNARAAAVAEDQ